MIPMIYIARVVSLLGALFANAGLVFLLVKLIFEPDLPDVLQDQWAPLFMMLGFAAGLIFLGSRLGNDLTSLLHPINDPVEREIRRYQGSSTFARLMYWDFFFDVGHYMGNSESFDSFGDGGSD